MKRLLFWLGLCLCLGVPNLMVLLKERSLALGGRVVYLKLAPVDPRSLMQGDYMALNYALVPWTADPGWPARGTLRAEIDSRGVITSWQPGSRDNLIRYSIEKGKLKVASDAFYFEEGQGARYSKASYGKFHLSDIGVLTLQGLTNENLEPL
ncbi:GDYXXLXY domain-containing protein [bacterium]|nr:GDYXXLXY domain-containing protein [bacterium]